MKGKLPDVVTRMGKGFLFLIARVSTHKLLKGFSISIFNSLDLDEV
jgi:hypothetical protein